jgi:lipoprotein-releasing system ATP-binding protein
MINDKKEMFTIKWDRAGRTEADAGFFLLRVLRKSENMNEETKDTLKKVAEFTAEENIMIPALIAGANDIDARARAIELMEMLDIADRATHKPSEMSGGEKQRIAVARALINRPDVILADEPSGSLDSKNRDELYKLFFNLRESLNQTFVIITHDESLSKITDRSIKIVDGMITTF